jgi:hypothetical protein
VAIRYATRLAAVLAAVPAAVLGLTPVLAAATWTVQPGGPVSLTSGKVTLKDTRTGAMTWCPSVRMSGTLEGGSGLPGSGIGSMTTVSFVQCGSGLPPMPDLAAAGLPWHVNVSSYNATAGVVNGHLSHVRIRLEARPSEPCTAVVDGTSGTARDGVVRFRYTNSTGMLELFGGGGNLHFYHVRHCAGLINDGDSAAVHTTFTVSPKQTITSP